ncbi:MAG: hypothetical protein L6R37_006423 [Teloschistes peruensis]|nr:MAG: hypothetical protein L6R37_006423 [Teloschistes peruensis]
MASAADSLSLTPAAIIFPTLVLITLFLDLPPLVWHVKNRNLAASNLIAWTILFNLSSFVNALIWPTDDIPNWFHGFVLCDIEVKLQLAATFGISGSLACIMRSLAKVLDTKRTVLSLTKRQRNLERAITALLCFGGPVYVMAIHYVVQPTRYYIIAISGSEKDDAATVTTASIPSPIEFEKFSRHEALMTGAAASSKPAIDSWDIEAKPPPLVPARSQTSFFSYVSRTRESPPPDDIEAILQDYDAHQPNRFIAGLWHANNANGTAAGMPSMHGGGIHMGNANGLRY